jgi:hypothetical protein
MSPCRRENIIVLRSVLGKKPLLPFSALHSITTPIFVKNYFRLAFFFWLWYKRFMAQKRGIAQFDSVGMGNHPLAQAIFWDIPKPYDWQADVITECAKPRSRVAVSSNNEAGKTNIIIPLLGLSIMTAFPGAIVFSTAGAEPQIKDQL